MRTTASPPRVDIPWHPRDREAHLLAGLLRMSRLTLLYGEVGSGKTTLLTSGVLLLLRRRASDHALARSRNSGVVLPFPDRRTAGHSWESGAEVAIFFDAWNEPPLASLQAKIHRTLSMAGSGAARPSLSLAETLAAWNKQLRVRFLIMLDRFEEYLVAPPGREGVAEFADQFVEAANRPFLAANFLISLRHDAEPLMERFGGRIQGFGDACLRLRPLHHASPLPLVLRPDADLPSTAPPASPPWGNPEWPATCRQEHRPIDALDVTPGTEKPLTPEVPQPPDRARHAAGAAANPTPAEADGDMQPIIEALEAEIATLPRDEPCNEKDGGPVAPAPLPRAASATANTVGPGGRLRLLPLPLWLAISAAVASAVFVMLPSTGPPGTSVGAPPPSPTPAPQRSVAATPAAAPAPPAISPMPAAHRFEIVAEAENSTDSRVARDLARFVAPYAGIDLGVLPSRGWSDGLAALHSQARLAIVRYDALQAARRAAAAGKAIVPLRVIMPLYMEEIYFIARADSPLTFIHEIKDRRINTGPLQSSRRLTGTTLYERMFGTRIPVSEASFLTEKTALGQLVHDKTLDVVIVVAAQPAALLAGMTAETARSIKLLKLDRNNLASRKALQAFLPATVRATAYRPWLAQDTPTLAVMSFLVTSDTADRAEAEHLGTFVRTLCANLPALQRDGHPKWREVQPGLQLPAGWPYAAPAEEAFRSCLSQTAAEKPAARPVVKIDNPT